MHLMFVLHGDGSLYEGFHGLFLDCTLTRILASMEFAESQCVSEYKVLHWNLRNIPVAVASALSMQVSHHYCLFIKTFILSLISSD